MTNAPTRNATRVMDILDRRLSHLEGYFVTAHQVVDDRPHLIVYFNDITPEIESTIPKNLFGYPVQVCATDRVRATPPRRPPSTSHDEVVEQAFLDGAAAFTYTRIINEDDCILRLPFRDSEGDPIFIGVTRQDDAFKVNDGGTIAGHLFSLDQHDEGKPVYELVMALQQAHGLRIDFDEGLVYLHCDEPGLYDAITTLAKIVITVFTAGAHLRP